MSVKGSSEAPKRFFSLRQPFATPRISPAERLRHTTILSASARLYVRRTRASVSNTAISPRNKVEDPGQHQTDHNELGKNLDPVKPTLAVCVFSHHAKHHRRHRGEQAHHEKMSHDRLPAAISNASSIVK